MRFLKLSRIETFLIGLDLLTLFSYGICKRRNDTCVKKYVGVSWALFL